MRESTAAPRPADWVFHHIGYATSSLQKDEPYFQSLGYHREGEPFQDSMQGVAGCFIVGAGPRIELLENLPGSRTLDSWLSSGVRFYHLAYEVPSLDQALCWMRDQRARVTVPPVPSVAFGGRQISFAMLRNSVLIEVIERGPFIDQNNQP